MCHACVLWGVIPHVSLQIQDAVYLWHAMPQSGKVSVTVKTLLQHYKEQCRAKRKRLRESSESPPALLPVSFALAKDWLLEQQKDPSEVLETGAVNEEA